MANVVELVVTTEQRGRGMQNARDGMNRLDKSAGRLRASFKSLATVAGGFLAASAIQAGLRGLTGFMGEAIDLAKEQARVEGQLNAVIKSTGGAAGLSADQIKKMAAGFQEITNFGDEATIASSNILLTFTKIGEEVFPRAQKSVLDMSTALGTDLQSASILVGKALNDPIKGVTALSRSGVQFTDTQRDLIRTMVESGDVAGAQALILGELETQFKGSAEAAVAADGGIQQAENAMGDLQEQIGLKLIPVMAKWKEIQLEIVTFMVDRVAPAVARFADMLAPVGEAILGVINVDRIKAGIQVFRDALTGGGFDDIDFAGQFGAIQAVGRALREVGEFFIAAKDQAVLFFNALSTGFTEDEGTPIETIALKIRDFVAFIRDDVLPRLQEIWAQILELWEELGPKVAEAFTAAQQIVEETLPIIIAAIQDFVDKATTFWDEWGDDIITIVGIAWSLIADLVLAGLTIVLGIIRTVSALMEGDWAAVWEGIKLILSGAMDAMNAIGQAGFDVLAVLVQAAWAGIMAMFRFAWDQLQGIVGDGMGDVVGLIAGMPGQIASAAVGMFNGVSDAFSSMFNRIRQLWDGLSFKVPKVDIPLLGSVGGFKIGVSSLPFFAHGGLRSGLAVVGDRGREIVDFGAGGSVMSNPDTERVLAGAGSQRGGGLTVVMNVAGAIHSEREIIELVRDGVSEGDFGDLDLTDR